MNPDPQFLEDQTEAALAETAVNMEAIAADIPDGTPVHAEDWPDWLRAAVLATFQAWAVGTAYLCEHRPGLTAPSPVFGNALLPGWVVCGDCLSMLRFPAGDLRDRTCYGCGVVTGEEPSDATLFVGFAAWGVLTLVYTCCADCKFWSDTHGPAVTT